jgi:hypothetical protein
MFGGEHMNPEISNPLHDIPMENNPPVKKPWIIFNPPVTEKTWHTGFLILVIILVVIGGFVGLPFLLCAIFI